MDTQGGNRLLTAKIVGSYLRHNKVAANQLPDLIATVHKSLGELGQQPPAGETRTPAVSLRQSVRQDYVICLDCGYRGKTLRRHISSRHGLSRAEYLSRWGLKPDHPLTAPAYSEHRSTLAKQLGLGRKPNAGATPTAAESSGPSDAGKTEADHASSRRVTAAGSDEAASQPKRTRQGRSRSRSAPLQSEPLATPTAKA
jgi:predicted transcriptional regulator